MLCGSFPPSAANVVTSTASDQPPSAVPAVARTWNPYAVAASSPVTAHDVPVTASGSYPATGTAPPPPPAPAETSVTDTSSKKNRCLLAVALLQQTVTAPATFSKSLVNTALSAESVLPCDAHPVTPTHNTTLESPDHARALVTTRTVPVAPVSGALTQPSALLAPTRISLVPPYAFKQVHPSMNPLFNAVFPLPLMLAKSVLSSAVSISVPPSSPVPSFHTSSSYPVAPATALHSAVNPAAFVALAHAFSGASSTSAATSNVRVTLSAGFQSASPAWLAVTLTIPAPVHVSVVPAIVAGPATAYSTASPLLAVAPSATVAPTVWSAISGNEIDCSARVSTTSSVVARTASLHGPAAASGVVASPRTYTSYPVPSANPVAVHVVPAVVPSATVAPLVRTVTESTYRAVEPLVRASRSRTAALRPRHPGSSTLAVCAAVAASVTVATGCQSPLPSSHTSTASAHSAVLLDRLYLNSTDTGLSTTGEHTHASASDSLKPYVPSIAPPVTAAAPVSDTVHPESTAPPSNPAVAASTTAVEHTRTRYPSAFATALHPTVNPFVVSPDTATPVTCRRRNAVGSFPAKYSSQFATPSSFQSSNSAASQFSLATDVAFVPYCSSHHSGVPSAAVSAAKTTASVELLVTAGVV